MSKIIKVLFVFSLVFSITNAIAIPPDIGDNTFFKCGELELFDEPGVCVGGIIWVADKNDNFKNDKALSLRKARKVIKNAIRFFKKKARKAKRKGDEELTLELQAKKDNAVQSKKDLRGCWEYSDECTGLDSSDDDDESNDSKFPSTQEACALVTNPGTYGELELDSSIESLTKFIVNGTACGSSGESPVLLVLEDGDSLCTGTYVGDGIVISAAHCFEEGCEGIAVRNSNLTTSANVTQCISHPSYGQTDEDQAHDLSILILDSNLDLPKAKIATNNVSAGALAAFAGYGRNESNDTNLRATFNEISDISTEVVQTKYTQGDNNEGTTCSGDSGGPIFVFQEGEWKTIGTLSDGSAPDCALPGTSPTRDTSRWANLSSSSNQAFIKDNTEGVLD